MTGFAETVITVFRKEMWEHFRTWRLIVIGGIFAFVFIVISLYGGILVGEGSTQLSFKAGANSVLSLVLSFTSYFPGLMAIVISYTAIVGERSRKSLILLISKPVKRPALFAGKFLSSYFAIVLVYIVVMTVGYLGVVGASGKVPSLEEVGRAYGAVGFVLMAMACWVVFAMFLSSVIKNPITVAVSAIMIWFLVIPIASSVGEIYYLVSSNSEQNVPDGVGVTVIPENQSAVVTFSGAATTSYTFFNDTVHLEGNRTQTVYTYVGVRGNYSWTASGGGINRNGTFAFDGQHGFSVAFDGTLTVSVTRELNATVLQTGRALQPTSTSESGPLRITTYGGNTGECRLVIRSDQQVLFSGGYKLTSSRGRGPFAGASGATAPDYVKYNQLISPTNAMTGYQQVLNPNSTGGISPGEGATALFIFFVTFLALGLLVFSKMEMV